MRISDWSSDVCSSDLVASQTMFEALGAKAELADIVPDEAAIVETVAAFTGRHGGVDLLVYAVTRIGTYALPTMASEQWDAVQDANLRGAFLAMRAVIPLMRAQGGGSIVAVSTMGSIHPVLKGSSEVRRVGKECVRTCRT